MKRAVLIVTDATCVEWYEPVVDDGSVAVEYPSEQLLPDLRTLVEKAERHPVSKSVADAAARVRALLPEEGEES